MNPLVWLASYPKSGNTWFRLMLANLGRDEPASINGIESDDGIASARRRFDETLMVEAGLLTHDECDRMRPMLYRHMAASRRGGATRCVKTHDAWLRNDRGEWLLGGRGAARGAVLILRDPRDVVASLANHLNLTLDATIAFMAREDSALAGRRDSQHLQLRQRLLDWSAYHASWLDQDEIPVHLLRYEEMQSDPVAVLGAALDFIGLDPGLAAIEQAVRFSAFDRLRAQEEQAGFGEAPVKMGQGRFFRQGKAGGWRHELDAAQRRRIEGDHGAMMARLGYAPLGQDA